ncbi:uncharacterized protein si:dkey-261h17.1 [Plectropomus leopardus]|uniref:uncharacterized protein si:dkey-261h17.1 n=1 Tax=Plectropomus leopardus TaxID=160734 RepID=UPI001C4B6B97|nr:uncharacterized protein si:dkey-261h17.1 [Plectropomus leopardus]
MAVSMWRMNGMAGVLVLCALLLSSEVMCQTDAPTDAPAPAGDNSSATVAAVSAAAPGATTVRYAGASPTPGVGGQPAASAGPVLASATLITKVFDINPDGGSSGATDAPVVDIVTDAPRLIVPDVTCVGEKDIPEGSAVKAELATTDCEATRRIILANPADWCPKDNCNLKIFQNDNEVQVASDDANLATLAGALQSEQLKEKLGATKVVAPKSPDSSVFVGILVTGLLAALAIAIGYFKCQRRPDAKGVRLAEEAYPVDQENQGNTLVSVAPLNPPPETPEKPSVNGESLEADKTQPPPPTNGTSTTKTADTEL